MDNKETTIPFGAFDSELHYHEINIPDGCEATIKDGKIIIRKIESEDEKIMKALIKFHKSTIDIDGIKGNEIVAWLEKQVEQKLADKVIKPKFHEGEWVVFNNRHDSVYQVEKIENYEYTLRHFLGGSMPLSFSHEDMIRAWTIQDARDGDVLTDDDYPCIFKSINEENVMFVYCGINGGGDFATKPESEDNIWSDYPECYFPATKDQRDTLFAKMKEAGYEWLEETKELKKIEQKSAEWSEEDETNSYHLKTLLENLAKDIKHEFRVISYNDRDKYTAWLKSLKYRVQPKQEWGEEEYKIIREVIHNYESGFLPSIIERDRIVKTLKSLKDRVQPEQEWNEEDEKMLNSFLHKVEVCDLLTNKENVWIVKKLKSLKLQNRWKPIGAQMYQLKWIAHQNADNIIGKELMTLYQDLQKLIE